MNEDDDSYVMADPINSATPPVKQNKKIIIGLLIGVCAAIAAALFAYLAKARTSNLAPVAPKSDFAALTPIASNQPGVSKLPVEKKIPKSAPFSKNTKQELIINFRYNSSELMPAQIAKIDSFWSRFKGQKGTVAILGHTDNEGTEKYNYQLSKNRAERVADFLKKKGMNAQYKLTILPLGETTPVVENDTERGRKSNRRAVVYLQVK